MVAEWPDDGRGPDSIDLLCISKHDYQYIVRNRNRKQAVLEYLGLGTSCGNIVKANKTRWYQATRMRSIAFQRVADVYQYKIESVREVLSAFLGSFAREIQSQMTASWP